MLPIDSGPCLFLIWPFFFGWLKSTGIKYSVCMKSRHSLYFCERPSAMELFVLCSLCLLNSSSSAGVVETPYYSDWGPPEVFTDPHFPISAHLLPNIPTYIALNMASAWVCEAPLWKWILSITVKGFGLASHFVICIFKSLRAEGGASGLSGLQEPPEVWSQKHAGQLKQMICFFPFLRLPKKV